MNRSPVLIQRLRPAPPSPDVWRIRRKNSRSQIGIKKGVWGESRFDFESIVKEVRRFVARMPPADSTTGLACCLRSFSALADQKAEILPVQRPPTLAVAERYMMRLTRILMFPFFSQHHGSAAPKLRCLPKCHAQRTSLETFVGGYTRLTGQST